MKKKVEKKWKKMGKTGKTGRKRCLTARAAPAARVTQLIRGFSASWKGAVEALSQDVMRSFSNFRIGTGIIQAALTQLIQVYHRFQKILEQPPLRALPARADLINIHHLMVELKKHKPNF